MVNEAASAISPISVLSLPCSHAVKMAVPRELNSASDNVGIPPRRVRALADRLLFCFGQTPKPVGERRHLLLNLLSSSLAAFVLPHFEQGLYALLSPSQQWLSGWVLPIDSWRSVVTTSSAFYLSSPPLLGQSSIRRRVALQALHSNEKEMVPERVYRWRRW